MNAAVQPMRPHSHLGVRGGIAMLSGLLAMATLASLGGLSPEVMTLEAFALQVGLRVVALALAITGLTGSLLLWPQARERLEPAEAHAQPRPLRAPAYAPAQGIRIAARTLTRF